jgi:hypothetical protein
MSRWLLIALMSAGLVCDLPADDQPTRMSAPGTCQIPNNRIVGPRTQDRPLPLLAGDAAHGFQTACTVAWSRLSPDNQSLPVMGCFQDSLLQLENDSACGRGTGRLWVSSRWVVTSADLQRTHHVVPCQRLDNSAVAATRDWLHGCVPQRNELQPATAPPAAAPPATSAPASTSAAATGRANAAQTGSTPTTAPLTTPAATTSGPHQ